MSGTVTSRAICLPLDHVINVLPSEWSFTILHNQLISVEGQLRLHFVQCVYRVGNFFYNFLARSFCFWRSVVLTFDLCTSSERLHVLFRGDNTHESQSLNFVRRFDFSAALSHSQHTQHNIATHSSDPFTTHLAKY